jgi:hypothetical protein
MRRTVVSLLALIAVAGGGFGVGYFLGHGTTPSRPGAVQSPAPRTVVVPKVLHLSMPDAVQTVMSADLAVGRVGTRTGGEPGTIVAQFPPPGTSAPSGSPVDLFVSTSVYPRGAFEWCPDVPGTRPVGPDLRQEAEQVALRFSRAFLSDDWTPRPCHFENVSGPSRERRAASMSAPSGCTGV